MAIFRWWGLGVFVGLVAVITGAWLLFADAWLEAAVEKGGTRLVGARVELAGADLGLVPFRVRLDGLQVTNPRAPMTNAFQAERIAFGLDTTGLVFGRRRIREVAVEGAALHAPRETSGALARPPEPPARESRPGWRLPGLEAPSPEEVLARADPDTPKAARALESDAKAVHQRLTERAGELPGEAEIAEFRQRLRKLEGSLTGGLGGLVTGGREVATLKTDIQRASRQIQALREAVQQGRKELGSRLEDLRQSPARDARRLATEYGPSPEGLTNLAEAFFGPRVGGWLRSARFWTGRLLPYLSPLRERLAGRPEVTASKPLRGAGIDLHFPSGPAEPRTVVQRVAFSQADSAPGGTGITGQLIDLTPQPALWPRPLRADLAGRRPGGGAFDLTAVVDHRDPAGGSNRLELSLSEMPVDGWVLAPATDVPIHVEKGSLEAGLNGRWSPGSLDLRLNARVGRARLRTGGRGEGELEAALAETVAGIRSFTLAGRVTGTLDDPEITLRSSLVDSLRSAVARIAEKRLQALEARLRERLAQRIEPRLAAARGQVESLAALDGRLEDRLGQLRGLLQKL